MNRTDNGSKRFCIVGMIQRAEKIGKERGKRRQENRTLRNPLKKVKTLMNIKENGRGLVKTMRMSKLYQIEGKNIIKRRDNPQGKTKIHRRVHSITEENRMDQRNTVKRQKHEKKRKIEKNITRQAVVTLTARNYNHKDRKHTKGLKRKGNRNERKKRKKQEKRQNSLSGLRKNTEKKLLLVLLLFFSL